MDSLPIGTVPWIGLQRLIPTGRSGAVIERAISGGIAWIDVGDAAEQLGPRLASAPVRVAVRGGAVGRPADLERAVLDSRRLLGIEAIALYQLELSDPRAPLRPSLRILEQLRDDGLICAVGVCNVGAAQLREALDALGGRLDAVQVELSPLKPAAVRSGVVEIARAHGVPVLAGRPLGGPSGVRAIRRHGGLRELASGRGCTPEQLVLAWLRGLGIAPVPGPTRPETLDGVLAAHVIALDDQARASMDGWFEAGRIRRPRSERRPPLASSGDGEVVVLMGSPGAGKTARVRRYAETHLRLNRDDRGGTLEGLVVELDRALAAGTRRVVLDNTYPARSDRNPVIEAAWAHGLQARCEWVTTGPDDAEVNVIGRILDAVGFLPGPGEIERLNRRDPGVIPPVALTRYRRRFEPPSVEEGFLRIDEIPFVRRPSGAERRALLLDPGDLVPRWAEIVRARAREGFLPVVIGWRPTSDPDGAASEWVERAEELGISAEVAVCPHPDGPLACWCRKPMPGLALSVLRRLGCAPERSLALGRARADRRVAAKLGIRCLAAPSGPDRISR